MIRNISMATLVCGLVAQALTPVPRSAQPAEIEVSARAMAQQIEEDWLKSATVAEAVSTRSDAAGGCDGLKDGKFGFHTSQEANPWWQVDIGQTTPIARVVIYNRLDYAPGLHNADHLQILTSEDGRDWTLRHENAAHFGGVRGGPLEVVLKARVKARFIRLRIPSAKPIYFHLDEVEVYGPEGTRNLALNRPADQSSLSRWSTSKAIRQQFPTAQIIERARRTAGELGKAGINVDRAIAELDKLARQLESAAGSSEAELQKLYLDARWTLRKLVLSSPLLDFDRLLFVKRFTQETYPDVCLNHMPWVSRPGGDLCVLSTRAGKPLFAALADPRAMPEGQRISVRHILNRALGPGHVHGMDLGFDGDRIVFGYARRPVDEPPQGWLDRTHSYRLRRSEEPIHLFEVGVDGKNLRQITSGQWSDLDPTYLPGGEIAFVSERCGTSLQCNEYDKDETSCNLYIMRHDGSNVRQLSVNKDGDYLPHTLDDGTIGYTRWEYHERSWAFIQSIWIVRPDGTGADAIFKQHFVNPWALEDARSIPGSRKLVAVAAGHHTLAAGPVVVINHHLGINEPAGIHIVTPGVRPPEGGMDGLRVPEGGVADAGGFYSTPWALSEKQFLVSYTYGKERDATGYALYLIDVLGNKELLHRDPAISCFIPIPLRARPKPPAWPDQTDPASKYATCIVNNASFGCEGVDPARVKFIRISEPIGWPYDNQAGGQRYGEDHRFGGPDASWKNLTSWTPIRVLGTVPVEADGSAHFRVSADAAVYFQLLDENQMELRRMRSFISFQPGEVRACVGCHESRTQAPIRTAPGLAAARDPSIPSPPPWGDRPLNFLRDIQPILDRHCTNCHAGLKPAGEIDLSGGLTSHDPQIPGYGYNRAFETIITKGLVSISAVRKQDASITPPLAYGAIQSKLITCLGTPAHGGVKLGADERLAVVTWIDANAPYHDRFVNKRAEKPPYDLAADRPLLQQIMAVHEKRCAGCHRTAEVSRLDWIDLRAPAKSLFLSAPLGGGKCRGAYKDSRDPDRAMLLKQVEEAVRRQWDAPRRDLVGLDPPGGSARK